MFTEADALLGAIFDNPDNDTPRLVYADWLDENGQETYARFVRVQCGAARCDDDTKRQHLRRWCDQLWRALAREWAPACTEPWPHIERLSWGFVDQLATGHFCRGMLRADVGASFDQLVRYEHCWPWFPAPRCILVPGEGGSSAAGRIAEQPRLARLRHVALEAIDSDDSDDWFAEQVVKFLTSEHLTRLVTLEMRHMHFRACYVPALLSAPNLGTLQEIRVEVGKDSVCHADWVKSRLETRFPKVVCV